MTRVELRHPKALRATLEPVSFDASPGTALFLHSGWQAGTARVEVACFTRKIPIWVDGLEGSVLGGMSGIARRHLALDHLQPGEVRPVHLALEQTFAGEGPDRVARGKHLFGFIDHDEVIGCTSACVDAGADPAWCAELLETLELEVPLVARQPGRTEALLALGLAHPKEAAAGLLLLTLAAVTVLLARRPRPRVSSAAR